MMAIFSIAISSSVVFAIDFTQEFLKNVGQGWEPTGWGDWTNFDLPRNDFDDPVEITSAGLAIRTEPLPELDGWTGTYLGEREVLAPANPQYIMAGSWMTFLLDGDDP